MISFSAGLIPWRGIALTGMGPRCALGIWPILALPHVGAGRAVCHVSVGCHRLHGLGGGCCQSIKRPRF